MTRGRKPKEGVRHKFEIKLYLWEGEDDDLLAFFEGLPSRKRAAGIRMALRSGGALADLSSTDMSDEDDDMDFNLDDFLSLG
jgi:hypothetical protein